MSKGQIPEQLTVLTIIRKKHTITQNTGTGISTTQQLNAVKESQNITSLYRNNETERNLSESQIGHKVNKTTEINGRGKKNRTDESQKRLSVIYYERLQQL